VAQVVVVDSCWLVIGALLIVLKIRVLCVIIRKTGKYAVEMSSGGFIHVQSLRMAGSGILVISQ
jgi:hypothetical protein